MALACVKTVYLPGDVAYYYNLHNQCLEDVKQCDNDLSLCLDYADKLGD
jgi:hypothetical protein